MRPQLKKLKNSHGSEESGRQNDNDVPVILRREAVKNPISSSMEMPGGFFLVRRLPDSSE